MAISAVQTVRELISHTVVTDKGSLVTILKRNGIKMPNNPSDKEVTVAVLMANAKSKPFQNDLKKLLADKLPAAANDFKSFAADNAEWGFTGLDDFQFTGSKEFFSADAATTSYNVGQIFGQSTAGTSGGKPTKKPIPPNGKTKVGTALSDIGQFLKDNVFTKENINTGIQLGLTSIANKQNQNANSIQSEAQSLQVQQDLIKQQLPDSKVGVNSTTKYLLIGVGVIALIGAGFLIYKKMKK
jgi:hypothetical protein